MRVREKILPTPPVGEGGEAHAFRNKCAEWASCSKRSLYIEFLKMVDNLFIEVVLHLSHVKKMSSQPIHPSLKSQEEG